MGVWGIGFRVEGIGRFCDLGLRAEACGRGKAWECTASGAGFEGEHRVLDAYQHLLVIYLRYPIPLLYKEPMIMTSSFL